MDAVDNSLTVLLRRSHGVLLISISIYILDFSNASGV